MNAIDLQIARWIADHRIAPVTRICRFLEDLGTSMVFFVIVALCGLALVVVLRLWAGLPSVMFSVLVTAVVTVPLKELFDRPRPPPELAITTLYEPAMPSSHAVLTSAIVMAVLMAPWWTSAKVRRIAAVIGITGCVVLAAAMIYLGGHWLSDVLVGWALGIGITGGMMLLWQRLPVPGGRTAV